MKRLVASTLAVAATALAAAPLVGAHPHVVSNPSHDQVLANGQNHPGFGANGNPNLSCEGQLEPANSGPAGYGLETAHHGPDSGTPGKADGCYQRDGAPDDQNPAID